MMALTVLACSAISCNTNVYDEEQYQKIIRYLSPVDSVDQRHTWSLVDYRLYRFNANVGSGISSLQVFTHNPLNDSRAELMNQTSIKSGGSATLMLSVPVTQDTLFAALVDNKKTYYVRPFSVRQREVDISEATTDTLKREISAQEFTYLFEEDYPEAGDYDYNDLVMRISILRTGTKQLTFNVTLVAVSSERQLAGAIRLIGKSFDDITAIETIGGNTFNDGVPEGSLYVLNNTDLLVRGRNNEAVINLFADAHWAMNPNVEVEYGIFKRERYNVNGSAERQPLRTISYVITFKTDTGLDSFTQAMLDPFVMAEYNSGVWETHLDEFRDAQVLYEYPSPAIKDLPWALMVPVRDFRYPLQGCEIGFKRKTPDGNVALFGAYMTTGHAFGEWVENYTQARDWYLYPTSNQVWDY